MTRRRRDKKHVYFKLHKIFLRHAGIWALACLAAGLWSPARAEVVDRILAVVNDDIVTQYEFNEAVKPYEARIRSLGYSADKERQVLSKVREEVLNQLIDEKLADQEIQRFKLSVSEKEMENAIERFKAANNLTEEGFREALKEEDLSFEEYRKRIREQILRSKLVTRQVKSKIVITQEEVRAYYESHPERYGAKKRLRLRHILLRRPSTDEGKEKKRTQMNQILDALKKGKPFADMARNHSEVLAEEGGQLGLFEIDELSEALQGALKGKGSGEFTDIVETDQGFQIVYIEEIVEVPAKELGKVSAEIEEALYQEQVKSRYDAWLSELKTRSIVKRID